MNFKTTDLVVVTPIFEDVEASGRLFGELAALYGEKVFVVAVDDGSVFQPIEPSLLESACVNGVVLRLRRNVGHQRSIAIGLSFVSQEFKGDYRVVVMDSDGEDLPSSISSLLEALDRGSIDIAVAERRSRFESMRFKAFYVIYRWLFTLLTGRTIRFGNFMAIRSASIDRLASMQELAIHVAAAVLSSRLRLVSIPIDRGPRYAGHSKMSFVGLVLHGFKALMVFAENALVRLGIACAATAGASVVGIAVAATMKLMGHATPGWFTVSSGILVLIFLQTGTLTLMVLMLTGVIRVGTVTGTITYREFVKDVLPTKSRR